MTESHVHVFCCAAVPEVAYRRVPRQLCPFRYVYWNNDVNNTKTIRNKSIQLADANNPDDPESILDAQPDCSRPTVYKRHRLLNVPYRSWNVVPFSISLYCSSCHIRSATELSSALTGPALHARLRPPCSSEVISRKLWLFM